jgi:hypothetical protein
MNLPVDRAAPANGGGEAVSGRALLPHAGRLAGILPRVLFIVTVL